MRFLSLERVQRLSHGLLHTLAFALSQEVLYSRGEFGIHIPSEGRAGVITQDTYEHDGVVLHMWPSEILGQNLAYLVCCCSCSLGRRLGSLDDDWEM